MPAGTACPLQMETSISEQGPPPVGDRVRGVPAGPLQMETEEQGPPCMLLVLHKIWLRCTISPMVQAPSVLVDKKFWEFKGGPNEVSISSFVNNLHCKGRESIEKLLTQCNTQLQNSSTHTGARIYNVLPMSQLGSVPAKHASCLCFSYSQ